MWSPISTFGYSSVLESTIVEANSRYQVRLINVRRIEDLLSRYRARSTCRRLLKSGIFVINGFGPYGIHNSIDSSLIHRLFPLIVWDLGRIRFILTNSLPTLRQFGIRARSQEVASFGDLGFENLKFGDQICNCWEVWCSSCSSWSCNQLGVSIHIILGQSLKRVWIFLNLFEV